MSASTASAAASNLPSDSRSGPFRRLSLLRTYTQNHFSPHSSSATTSGQRSSYRNTLSSRVSWFSPSSHSPSTNSSDSTSNHSTPESSAHSSPVTSSGPSPCPESDRSTLARYSSVFFSSYRGLEIDLHSQGSSPSHSSRSSPSNESGGSQMQGTMARLRRLSQTLEARSNAEAASPVGSTSLQNASLDSPEPVAVDTNASTSPKSKQKATIRFFPHQDSHQSSRPSLHFIPVSRTLPSETSVIRVGRYSERDGVPVANPSEPSDAPVGFKSKVVSRRHCEFIYTNGQWHVKDVGSSSGTFLNHMRLSQPNMVSRLYTVKDGDIVQLGIDFRGGEEMIFRCVRIRIECNRSWQQQPNEFNKNTESLIKNLGKGDTADYSGCRECSICLGSVLRPYQCLFMAACAHVWHYKCVSRLIHTPEYPMFQCPNCRAYTDLSAEVDDTNDFDEEQKGNNGSDSVQRTPEEEPYSETPSPPPNNSTPNGTHEDVENGDTPNDSDEPVENGNLSSDLPEEAGLAVNIENLHLQDGNDSDDDNQRAAPTLNTDNIPRSSNIDIPGWQSVGHSSGALHNRQNQLRSDTPVRSDTSDDNPLTPQNDSGPLAFDGRAGML